MKLARSAGLFFAGLACVGMPSCSNSDARDAIAGPVARARAAAIVQAEEMVVGEPITQAQVDWAADNAAHWEELWLLVKDLDEVESGGNPGEGGEGQ